MFEILNNPWTVGIGGGILSGLAVALITRAFLEKKDDREFLERVGSANKELIYAVRPCIAEGAIPSLAVVESLITSTARKYRLDSSRLSTPAQLVDDLIKEVMDSSFISATTKADYCTKLSAIFEKPLEPDGQDLAPSREAILANIEVVSKKAQADIKYKEYRQRLFTMMSAMMGMMAALMTASFTLFDVLKIKSFAETDFLKVLLPVVASTAILLVVMSMTRLTSRLTSVKIESRPAESERKKEKE